MSKEKAIELIKEVKHSLFLVKSMLYIRNEKRKFYRKVVACPYMKEED